MFDLHHEIQASPRSPVNGVARTVLAGYWSGMGAHSNQLRGCSALQGFFEVLERRRKLLLKAPHFGRRRGRPLVRRSALGTWRDVKGLHLEDGDVEDGSVEGISAEEQ